MPVETKLRRVKLSGDDKEAATRLYKQAYGALDELAKLSARVLGTNLSDKHQPMFLPKRHKPKAVRENEVIEFRGIEIDCDEDACYCIDYDNHEIFLC